MKTPASLSGEGGVTLLKLWCTKLIAQSGLYSFISQKSAAADEKRTLVANDTTSGSFIAQKKCKDVALQYKQEKNRWNLFMVWDRI